MRALGGRDVEDSGALRLPREGEKVGSPRTALLLFSGFLVLGMVEDERKMKNLCGGDGRYCVEGFNGKIEVMKEMKNLLEKI